MNSFHSKGKLPALINETNFNLFGTCGKGQILVGTGTSVSVANCRRPNLQTMGAMTSQRLLNYSFLRGLYKKEKCMKWVKGLLAKLRETMSLSSVVKFISQTF